MSRYDEPLLPPDYVLQLIDAKTGKRVVRNIKVSHTQLATNAEGRKKSYEYAVSEEAKRAYRDMIHLHGGAGDE